MQIPRGSGGVQTLRRLFRCGAGVQTLDVQTFRHSDIQTFRRSDALFCGGQVVDVLLEGLVVLALDLQLGL
jgi:hypothetical protein